MISIRPLALAALLLGSLAASPAALAQGKDVFSLRAAVGGAVPYAQKESFIVANLTGSAKDRQLSVASSLPLSPMVAPVFEARPQVVLNGRLDLGRVGPGALSLNAYVSAGVVEPEPATPRPMLGLAALRLVF